MAKCEYCNQEMTDPNVNGCTFTHAKKFKGDKHALRDTGNITGELRCHDCGAMKGYPHHPGCDNERCPFCGTQSITCTCKYMLAKKKPEIKGKLSDRDRKKYVKQNGVYCPYCGSRDTETQDQDDPDFGYIRRSIGCCNCHKTWNVVFKLVEMLEINE